MMYRLDSEGNIKVSDFGLSEDVYTTGYFRQSKGRCSEATIQVDGSREFKRWSIL